MIIGQILQLLSITRALWKPTTDNESYRQSLSNYTISWWFVVLTKTLFHGWALKAATEDHKSDRP